MIQTNLGLIPTTFHMPTYIQTKFIVINVQPSKELFIDSQSLGGLKYPAGWISVLLLLLDCNHGTSQYKDVKYRSPC